VKLALPYLVADTDRHGNVRYYYRRKGKPKIRVKGEPGSPFFLEQYRLANEGQVPPRTLLAPAAAGTLRWLCAEYYKSAAYRSLGERTRRVRRLVLEGICQSKTPSGRKRGLAQFAAMEDRHVREIRDERADRPGSANNCLKALGPVFVWAKEAGHAAHNPVRDVKRFSAGPGWHTWTDEEIAQFEKRHPIGTKPRLAFALFRYLGVRRSDAVKLGKGMEFLATDDDGNTYEAIRFKVTKGSERRPQPGKPAAEPKWLAVPILPELREILEATPSGHLTYLVTKFGKPFSVAGLGNWFRDQCNAADLPHCSAHGIRKYGATHAAEAGATEHQLMGMFGWDDPKQAAMYTRKARQQKLARASMHLLSSKQQNKKVS
jgi:integrase